MITSHKRSRATCLPHRMSEASVTKAAVRACRVGASLSEITIRSGIAFMSGFVMPPNSMAAAARISPPGSGIASRAEGDAPCAATLSNNDKVCDRVSGGFRTDRH